MSSYKASSSYTVKTAVLVLQAEACALQQVLSSVRMFKRSEGGGETQLIALMQAQHSPNESHLRDDHAPIPMHFSSPSIYWLNSSCFL